MQSVLRGGQCAASMEERDFVFLEQIQNAIVVLLDYRVFAGQHLRDIHGHAGGANAVVGKMVQRVVEVFAGLQQGLGGNASDIGAGAAGRRATLGVFPFVDAGHLKAQLGCANRRDIAAGAGADNDDVKFCAHGASDQISNKRREGSSIASLIATSPRTASRPSMMRWS